MTILYIHQYFRTPEEGGIIRSYYLAKGLIEAGHKVEMITASNKKNKFYKDVEGINVRYLPVFYENKLTYRQRIISFTKFFFLALIESFQIKNFDLCFASSTPLTVGVLGLVIKFLRGKPYIFEVRDLWPKAPVELSILTNPVLVWLAYKAEMMVYNYAKLIIALSPGMKEYIATHSKTPVVLVPNISDCDFFQADAEITESSPVTFSANNKLVVGYFGAIGVVNDLSQLIALADKTQSLNIQYRLFGKGKEVPKILEEIKKRRLENVEYRGFIDKHSLKSELHQIHAAYVSFANYAVLETCSPNKFFDALAAGKLIITNTRGWIKELCEQYQCGIFIDSKNSNLDVLKSFIDDKSKLDVYQSNARALAETQFNRRILTKKFTDIIERTNN